MSFTPRRPAAIRSRGTLAATLALALAAYAFLLNTAPARAQAAPGVKVSVLRYLFGSSTLTAGPDGSLFGTLQGYGHGILFKVTLGGQFHSLIEFNGNNGASPDNGPLLLLPDGSFFGSTTGGGKSDTGVLFKFTPTRRYQVKHEFASVSSRVSHETNVRGADPEQPMALAPDGAIYGVTRGGGSTGNGVLFRYTAAHGVEVLHTFTSDTAPDGGLTLGSDGALYGTHRDGSQNSGQAVYGQIFRCTTTGGFSVLHMFTGSDGGSPNGAPVLGPDGGLYGTTFGGGVGNDGLGTAYRIMPDGSFTRLHSFNKSEGVIFPRGTFVVGPDSKFYGTASDKDFETGVLYRMAADGTVSVLYRAPKGNTDIGFDNKVPVFGRDNRLYVSGYYNLYKVTVPF